MRTSNGETYLRAAEAADLLHVGPKTISRWAKDGILPFTWTKPWMPEGQRGHRRFPESKLRELVGSIPPEDDRP